ncbi:phage tail tape measure protein [Corynebacterium diphtheriae]|nr:phage tail tape measure protein [Corynebacterium diphtheriae]CAB0673331.1 phage tail tape measure protein [Corynebacterium diphtheriae]CAB0734553.1 phage tail tape measure protein [Corynebacterium diphtheriae]CAB0891908.1 phage tail tape measure protein [Corynebacterium diphtheriae]CAB1030762.1 phage tail tape measure protein [Corynebacterium diphtheriae]
MAGGKIDILVEPDVKGFGPKMEAGLRPALGVAGKLGGALGLAFAGAGIAGLGKEIIDVGNTYRTEMNSLQAVTQASGAAMEAAAAKARALGNDMDLPATSAGDAAAAMTELAKGGFTLQESMEAAKGTLQLAAAAQIDAASAATIQSQALQAFGLTADYASTAADVLSGAANASSAEITGIAHGLQQAGTVAHQFGVSMEDTATTLAVFANAGIQGSDAGTLMKSALLALTDQGKPAQAAIEELGLTVYDAHGKFVGMSDLFDQLNLAASRMTDEQYQAATATLFGSDAMRLAGIAAQQGAEGFNRTRAAVTRAGQAAELAAAQTQGLPGAIEKVGNAWEETALGIYTSVEGPLAEGLGKLAEGITDIAPVISGVATTSVNALGSVTQAAGSLGSAFASLPAEVQHVGLALAGLSIAKHVGLLGALSDKATAVKTGFSGFSDEMRVQAALAKANGVEIGRMGQAMAVAEARAVSGLKASAKGVISAFGGPWMVGLGAATYIVGEVANESRKAAEQQKLLEEATRASAQAHRDMAAALAAGDTAGAINAMSTALDGFLEKQQQLAETKPGKFSGALSVLWEGTKDFDLINAAMDTAMNTAVAERAEKIADAFQKVGASTAEMTSAVTGSKEKFDALTARFDQTTEGGKAAVAQLTQQREAWQRIGEETKNLAPGATEVSEAVAKIGDASSSAADKAKALNSLLDQMFGQAQSKDDAAAKLAEHIDQIGDAAEGVADKGDGFGDSLFGADGKLDLYKKNSRELRQELIGFRDELGNVAASGGDMASAWEQTQGALTKLGEHFGLSSEQVRDLASSMGLMPPVIETLVSIKDDEAKKSLAEVWVQSKELSESLGQPKEFQVADVEKTTDDLKALGFQVEVINKETGQIKVTAQTEEALSKLDTVMTSTAKVDQLQAGVTIDVEDEKFRLGIADYEKLTTELDGTEISAKARFDIEELLQGKETSLAELRALSEEVADPQAKLVLDQLIEDKKTALNNLNEVAQKKTEAKISANNDQLKTTVTESKGLLDGIPKTKVISLLMRKTWDKITGNADGGIAGYAAGGRLPVTGPGTDQVDGILGVDAAGMPVARVDAGEWVINRRSSERYHDILRQINEGTFPALAAGGLIKSAAEIKRSIAFMHGTPYLIGGWTPAATDCSGAVSGTTNVAVGLPFFDSRTSTVSEGPWLDAKGALPGRGGPGDITIGWWDRGGGANGHTAMVLQDGTFVESGGNTGGGFTIGKTAGPLDGRGFTDWRHFKGNGEVSESDRTSTIGSNSRGDANWGSAHELHSLAERYVGLYDQGGYLPHGGLALNLSGKPEPVFTAGQWSKMDQLLALMGKVVQQGSGGLGFLSHSQLVIDAEKGLAETRKSIAEETVDLRKKEEAVADARKGLTKAERDAADNIADKEQALAKARESGKADKIEKAERDLAKAREDAPDKAKKAAEKIEKAEKDLNDLRDKSTDAAKRLEAAERTVIAARFKAAADMVTGVSEALQAGIGHIQKYFSVMGDLAEMVEKTRQEVSKLQMQQTTNRLQLIKSVQDLQVKEWDLQRTRAMGAVSVAQAEAELEKARRQQAKLGATSIEAMSGAMDRFRRTGIFSIEEVASSVVENSSAVRAAQWQVEAAKAQAAIDELEATHAQAAAQLQVAEATLAQNAAAEMLRLNTAALTEQARELYGLTSNQARGAAAGFGGIGRVVGGLGKIIGGILGGLAGFAAGGPLGAVAGAGMALGGLGDVVRGGFDIHNNKREMAEAWKGMSPGAKAGVMLGAVGGAALSIGGGALAGRLGPDAAVGGAKLADQWTNATIGSMAYGVESKIAAMQRRQADKQSALSTAIEAQKLQLEAKKLSMQTEHASKVDALKAQLDYAQLQKQLAEASTKREAEALAKAAEVAAQRREAMLALAQRQTVQQDETNRQLALLVEAQRAAAKKAGINTSPVEFTLPEGDAFTRGQTEAMLREVRDEYERRIAALTQVDANRFVDSKIG